MRLHPVDAVYQLYSESGCCSSSVPVWELNAIITIDVVGAVIACLTVWLVHIPELEPKEQSAGTSMIQEMREGFTALKANKGLLAMLLMGTLYMLVYMPINALYPLITAEHFAGGPMQISFTEIAYASGMLLGGMLLGLTGGFGRPAMLMSASIMLMGISMAISGLLSPAAFVLFVICCAAMGLSVPFYSGVQTALFQQKVRPEYLGRVFSLTGSIMSLAMPIGLILSGMFADRIGVNRWFLLSGVATIAIGVLFYLIPSIREFDNEAPLGDSHAKCSE